MSNYRRIFIPGGAYFFTVVTYQRRPIFAAPENVVLLREAFHYVRTSRPFTIDGIVVLPDHLHCIWRLPEADTDFPGRWREIKKQVSKRIGEKRKTRNALDVWQPRFWDHLLRNEEDWRRHMDYIHYNPVKHGLATSPAAWPYSSFHKVVAKGWYPEKWGSNGQPETISEMDLE
ncbi:REP-associated tyrosine transposase [Methylosarcina fibrata]|uniref:REP-associated tyrosine transposase n=1 Tax=Methylosarcina fibrata TaxID=105972 RepID=UPI0003715521|nr:transposase [Methylosarcina fibrata]